MGYSSLAQCVSDLEEHGFLRRIDFPVDPYLEMAAIQRRALKSRAPALLFTNPKNCQFPMLANLFGTRERIEFIFRNSLPALKAIFKAKSQPQQALRNPLQLLKLLPALSYMRPKKLTISKNDIKSRVPVLEMTCGLDQLPNFVSWPDDGGPFITLPLVYSQDPATGQCNLGMYRVQLSGNDYESDEVGLHYQLHRGIGIHHARALQRGESLPVYVYVGGPPSLTMAAVMPLPEGMSELVFAGVLGSRRIDLAKLQGFDLPVLSQCDFLLKGHIGSQLKPEGPFGDHIGYYSLKHDFPFLKIEHVYHRKDAIWPFTSVGRPPQEDTLFGDFIHELTGPLVPQVFGGVKQVHAVDAAGVHPLLLAIGSERYTPYEQERKPRELLTQAMHLLGTTQTALAKYLLIAAEEDSPALDAREIGHFFRHMLERTDFRRDLHFITRSICDTLDYSGNALNEGSRLIWTAAGPKIRKLGTEINGFPVLPDGFSNPQVILPGILALAGPLHTQLRGHIDKMVQTELCNALKNWDQREQFPFLVIVDDADFCKASLENFLWVTFTRTDPATDSYGINAQTETKHWSCEAPFILDARSKYFHAPPLEESPEITSRIEALAEHGGPLEGIF